jgi:lysophospholipase L1-like esterase
MRFLSLLLAFVVSCAAADTPKTRVVLAGDSTVTDTAGWGKAFAALLGPQAECINLAAGGRSSKSFRTEGKWKAVLDLKPAFVLIQFGHNDMPGKGPERETDPATTFPENMGRFVDEVRAAGGQPILVTSMARRVFTGGKLAGELKPWANATAKVAAEKKVPLVDLFERSVALLEKLGPEASDQFNPPGKDKKSTDRTHLNTKGAEVMAKLVADELRKVAPELAKLLK